MRSYELLREGEVSRDGRWIWPGATKWEDGPVPLLDPDGRLLGALVNIRRLGRMIYGDTNVDAECITVTAVIGKSEDNAFEELTIVAGTITEMDQYPWSDDVA